MGKTEGTWGQKWIAVRCCSLVGSWGCTWKSRNTPFPNPLAKILALGLKMSINLFNTRSVESVVALTLGLLDV